MPLSTSIAIDQRVKELIAEIAELKEKCSTVDALKAEAMLMRKMFSQLNPLFTISQVKKFKVHLPCFL